MKELRRNSEELRNMESHIFRKSCSGLGQDTTFRFYLNSRASRELLGRVLCVSLPYLMCLFLIFSAELFFGGELQLLTLSTLLFHVVPFQTFGNFAIGLTGPGSELGVFSSSSKTHPCRDLKVDAELGDLAVLGMLDSMALEGLFQPKAI